MPTELEEAEQAMQRLLPAYKAFLATLSWEDELNRSLGQLPDRESPECERLFLAAKQRWLDAKNAIQPKP